MSMTAKHYEGHLVRYATYASVSVAVTLIVVKFGAYVYTGSVSIQATLIDSILDAAASFINMLAVRKAQQPPSSTYRFGHGKAEAIAALAQSLFIAASAVWLIYEAFDRFTSPQVVTESHVGVIVMVIAMILTYILIRYQRYVVERTNSAAIKADSVHYLSDFLINGGVIVALVGAAFFDVNWLDPLCGSLIAIYILYTAWSITREAFYILMDHELPEDIREKVKQIALSHPEVGGIHAFRTRSSGLKNFIQLHLELDGNMPLNKAHEIADEVEALILAEFPLSDVIIHQDPILLKEPHRNSPYGST